jgi:hypothetical protein
MRRIAAPGTIRRKGEDLARDGRFQDYAVVKEERDLEPAEVPNSTSCPTTVRAAKEETERKVATNEWLR